MTTITTPALSGEIRGAGERMYVAAPEPPGKAETGRIPEPTRCPHCNGFSWQGEGAPCMVCAEIHRHQSLSKPRPDRAELARRVVEAARKLRKAQSKVITDMAVCLLMAAVDELERAVA